MRELSAPLRLTWDLPPDPALAGLLWRRAEAARVLFAEVRVSVAAAAGLAGLAPGLAGGSRVRVSFVGEPAALAAVGDLLGPQAGEFVALPPYGPLEGLRQLTAACGRLVPGLWSTPEGLGWFGPALALARELGLGSVAVLNPPAPAPALTAADRARAAAAWAEGGDPGLELRVHDLFLAEALGQDPFAAYGGCQAAAGLAHLSADGVLRACRTLPAALGDLAAQPL
ncbi:MAG: hypothetical protein ACYDA8_21750, partial [Deferrisomatales bacterium]